MEENQEKIVEIALDRLNQEGLWFATKDDKMYANATNLFKLDKFGNLDEKSLKRLVEEITDNIGEGADSIIGAVDLWLEDNLALGTIGYVDTLAMNFEIPEVTEEVTAYSENGVKDLGAEESEEADQLKDHAEEPKKEDKKKKTESKKIVEDSEEDDSICIDDWYFDNEDLGNVVKLKTTNEKKLNEITEKISEQTIEDSYIDPMSIKSNTEFSFFVHQAYPKQICKFVEEAIRCGLFITKDVNKALEALDSALKEAVADRIEAHAIWKKNLEDELEKIRNGEPVEDKSVKQRADNLIMKDLDVEELQKIYTYVNGWKSCNDIDVDGVFGNSSGQFIDDELESDGSKEYLKWIKDMYLEAIQEAIDVAKENEEQFEESKKITEAYNYYWKDDIDEVDAESEANDELFYAVAEHMQETDEYYSSWDVYDIMSDIICLWKIEKRSRLYDYLIKWYGSEEEMLKHVRDVYETNDAIYFVTGVGYSIFSADLLGGKADGQAERDFDAFVKNGGKKEENKLVESNEDFTEEDYKKFCKFFVENNIGGYVLFQGEGEEQPPIEYYPNDDDDDITFNSFKEMFDELEIGEALLSDWEEGDNVEIKEAGISEEDIRKLDKEFGYDLFEESKKITEAKDINNLKSELENKIRKVMTSTEFGFEESDVNDYFTVEVSKAGVDGVKVEVRAEVSYEGLEKLADALNPIAAKYDIEKVAYFDAEQPGILVTYLTADSDKLVEDKGTELSFEDKLKNIFSSVTPEEEYGGYIINDSDICIHDGAMDSNGDIVEGVYFYTLDSANALIPDVQDGNLDIQAPDYIRDKDGVPYGDTLTFFGLFDEIDIQGIYNELCKKIKYYDPDNKDENGFATIIESKLQEAKGDFEAYKDYILNNMYVDSETGRTSPEIIKDNIVGITEDTVDELLADIIDDVENADPTYYKNTEDTYYNEIKQVIEDNADKLADLYNKDADEFDKKIKNLTEAWHVMGYKKKPDGTYQEEWVISFDTEEECNNFKETEDPKKYGYESFSVVDQSYVDNTEEPEENEKADIHLVNDEGEQVTISYNEEVNRWIDNYGRRFMGYLEPKDIKYYYPGYHEEK